MFLLAYFLTIDGVDTVITISVAYGIDIGLGCHQDPGDPDDPGRRFPCSLIRGKLSDRFPVKPLLQAGIALYCVIVFVRFLLPSVGSLHARTVMFWLLCVLVATAMGGIQALCRSFFGCLIPADRSAEFFGFYNISGKLAAIAGPLLFGVTSQLTGHSRYGVLSILFLLLGGSVILSCVHGDSDCHGPNVSR